MKYTGKIRCMLNIIEVLLEVHIINEFRSNKNIWQKLFEQTIKQYIALMRLGVIPMEKVVDGKWVPVLDEDWDPVYDTTTEVLGYGGAAGWGKSVLISRFLKECVEKYPGTRWFLARNELKRLKQSTLLTFFETLTESWYVKDGKWPKWYTYFDIKGLVQFNNGSVVHLLELGYQPGDPHYGRIGSTEYTGGAIDEAAEIDFDWFDAISSRVRYKLESFCHNCAWEIGQKDFIKQIEFENPDFGKTQRWNIQRIWGYLRRISTYVLTVRRRQQGWQVELSVHLTLIKVELYKIYRKFKEWNYQAITLLFQHYQEIILSTTVIYTEIILTWWGNEAEVVVWKLWLWWHTLKIVLFW